MAADRAPRTSAVSGIGLGASLLVIAGLFLHRIGQTPGTNGADGRDHASSNAASAMKGSDSSSPGTGQPKSGAVGPAPPDYLAPIAHFLGLSITELCSSGPLPGERTVLADHAARYWVERWGPALLPYKPKFLIAMLPDPDRSRSGFRFDLWAESLQRAASAADPTHQERTFVLDHYYLPWKHGGEERTSDSQAPRTFPGVLVFRSTPPPPQDEKPSKKGKISKDLKTSKKGQRAKLVEPLPPPPGTLIVFLIGDAPIGGIHKRALETSLDIVAWFANELHTTPPELRIIGPVFSGSQFSLQTALQLWWTRNSDVHDRNRAIRDPRRWIIKVIGTATAFRFDAFEWNAPLANGQRFLNPQPGSVKFKTTSIPDRVLVDHLLWYLEETHHGKGEINVAHLRESNTGYGTSSGDEKDFAQRHPKVKLIDVPFPLHISGVHAKHEEALRRDEANVPQFSAFDHGLKIPVNKGEGAGDTLPQQDEVMSAVYQDIALSSALQTLAKQRVPYILISATDPRDKIFLASVVDKHCPDARLLVTIGDQLYTHSDYVRYLSGAYVASSYPLSPVVVQEPQQAHEAKERESLTSFGENMMFTYYNAVAAQLDKPGTLAFYDCRKAAADNTITKRGLCVWLSQVGPERADVLRVESPRFIPPGDQSHVWFPDDWKGTDSAVESTTFPNQEPTVWWSIWLWGTDVVLIVTAFYARGIAREYCRTMGHREALVHARRDAAGHIEASSREMLRLCRDRLKMFLFAHWLAILLISAITGYLSGIVLRPGLASGVPFAWAMTLDVVVFSVVGLVVRAILSPAASQAGSESSGLGSGMMQISTIPNGLATAEAPAAAAILSVERSLVMNVAPTVALACSFALGAMVMFAGGAVIATRWYPAPVLAALDWSGGGAVGLLLLSVVPYCCGYRTSRFLPLLAAAVAAAAAGYLTGVSLNSLLESVAPEFDRSTAAIFFANAVLLVVFGLDLSSWQAHCLWGLNPRRTSEAKPFQKHQALAPNTKVPPRIAGIMIVLTMMIAVIYMQTFALASESSDRWFHTKVINVVGWNSPLVPFLLVASIMLCWCWLQSTQIKRLNDFESNWDPLDVQYRGEQAVTQPRGDWIGMKLQKMQEANQRAFRVCSQWSCWPVFREPKSKPWNAARRDADAEEAPSVEPEKWKINWYLAAGCAITVYGLISVVAQPWLPGPDRTIVSVTIVGIIICWVLIAWEVGRMWHIWTHLEDLHRTAARLPMQHVYENLPEYFSRVYGAFFFVERYRGVNSPSLEPHLQWVLQQREQLGLKRPFSLKEMVEDRQQIPSLRRGAGSWVRQYCRAVRPDIERLWAERLPRGSYIYSRQQSGSVTESPPAKAPLDLPRNPLRVTVDLEGGTRPSVLIAPSPGAVDRKQATQKLTEADEELLGMTLVAYLSQYRIQLKGLAFFLMGAPILLLLAAASYTFMPQGILMDFTALLALASLVVLAIVYSGLNKDEFLSRVTGTSPRWYSVNPDSVTTFLVIILPLALALASRLPGGEVVYDWFSSVIRSLPSQS